MEVSKKIQPGKLSSTCKHHRSFVWKQRIQLKLTLSFDFWSFEHLPRHRPAQLVLQRDLTWHRKKKRKCAIGYLTFKLPGSNFEKQLGYFSTLVAALGTVTKQPILRSCKLKNHQNFSCERH